MDNNTHSLPLFTSIEQQHCLIVGGGTVAYRRASTLLDANAHLTVLAPALGNGLTQLLATKSQQLNWINKYYTDGDIESLPVAPRLIIAASDCETTNLAVARAAKEKGILCNVVSNPKAGDFTFASTIKRDPITIAISSGGASPVLSRSIKNKIEHLLPQSYSQLAQLANNYRQQVKKTFSTVLERRRFWEHVFTSRVAELVLAKREVEAKAELEAMLVSQATGQTLAASLNTGEVYLVGAGPGDPELLTLRAHRLMQQADVVVYDRLVSDEIMSLCRADAIKVYAGKKRNEHTLQQHEINDTLVSYARKGYRVLRLKGGDPFIFGRGGEEIETLSENNIPFQVVPGITAASGCSAYAGIPLTHRDHAQAAVFVTGHLKNGNLELPWESLTQPSQTVVCYMGLSNLPEICSKLVEHGMDHTMPAAIIEKGTTDQQRVITATVGSLADAVAKQNVSSPAMVVFGSVVSLHDKLAWHGKTHEPARATVPNQSALLAASKISTLGNCCPASFKNAGISLATCIPLAKKYGITTIDSEPLSTIA